MIISTILDVRSEEQGHTEIGRRSSWLGLLTSESLLHTYQCSIYYLRQSNLSLKSWSGSVIA